MPRRLPFLLLTLVLLLPLLGLGWLGWQLGLEQRHAWERQLGEVLERRLWDVRGQALAPLNDIARQVEQRVAEVAVPELVVELEALPFVDQVLAVGPGGDLRYPDPATASASQRRFLQRAEPLWQGKALLHAGDGGAEGRSRNRLEAGWLGWHWGNGMDLLYWRRLQGHGVIAVAVDRIGLLSDLIAGLPEQAGAPGEGFRLLDQRGGLLYQWGGYQPLESIEPRAELALPAPLDSWRLALYFDDSALRSQGGRLQALQIGIAVGTLALVLLGLGLWLFRELRRAAREARERVNFVNQVSHELRTPLTNIRMYAELLEDSVADDPPAERKLGVIVTESRRLGRLIDNVLSFARQQKKTLKLNRVDAVLDEVVAEVVEQFRPGLAARGIEVELRLDQAQAFAFDRDAVAGILGNLLSNAEKYAPNAPLTVATSAQRGRAVVIVCDQGPGIARRHCKRIFKPFYRVSDKLTEGVSGTGIGLSIARELARLHGGELRMVSSENGACFELELPDVDG